MKGSTAVDYGQDGGGTLGAVDRTIHVFERATALISGIGIFLLMLLGVAQILLRKFFNAPILGYIDLVEITMTFLVFLGLAYTERLGGHIRMEIFVNQLKGRALWLFEIVGVIVGLFVVGVLIKYSWDHALRAYYSGDSTIDAQYLWWPSKMVVPASLALLFLRLLVSLVGYLRLLADPGTRPVGVPENIDVDEQARRDVAAAGVDLDNETQGGSHGAR